MGYYTEMKDPKNAYKTVDELKAIVLKNMVKDVNYYHTETSFGVKGIGYTKDVVGGGDAVAPKGKYKSSGYGDMPKAKVVKEGINEAKESMDFSAKDQKDWSEQKSKMYDVWANKSNELVDLKDDLKKAKNRNDKDEVKRINSKILQKQIAIKTAKEKFQKLSESLNEAKKSNVHSRIKDLEKQNEVLALESKITALEEAINELTQKVSLSESDELTDMMDPKKINELKKDIKVLEKYKMTCEKKLSKLGGKKTVVDNENMDENMDMDKNAMNEY
jgi:chromosome segregation ATPase